MSFPPYSKVFILGRADIFEPTFKLDICITILSIDIHNLVVQQNIFVVACGGKLMRSLGRTRRDGSSGFGKL